MDLALTMRGDYAVRAAVSLGKAFKSGGFRKIRQVAAEMDLPARYTPQILNLQLEPAAVELEQPQPAAVVR